MGFDQSESPYIDRVLEPVGPQFFNEGMAGVQGENYGTAVGSAKDCLFTEVHNHFGVTGKVCQISDGSGCGGKLQKNDVVWEQNTNLTGNGLIEILNRFALRAIPPQVLKPVRPKALVTGQPTIQPPAASPYDAAAIKKILGTGFVALVAGFIAAFVVVCLAGIIIDIDPMVKDGLGIMVTLVAGAGGALVGKAAVESDHRRRGAEYLAVWADYQTRLSDDQQTAAAYQRVMNSWRTYKDRWPLSWTCVSCGSQHVFQR